MTGDGRAARVASLAGRIATLAAWALVLVGGAHDAFAEPRFAVREGVTCVTCHVNPTGAGLRNDYGRYVYAPAWLPSGYPAGGEARPLFDIDLGETIDIGADSRTLILEQFPADNETQGLANFYQMQADVYLAATLGQGLTLYYDQSFLGSFEAFGMYRIQLGSPNFATYLKLGRFVPAFGFRLPNHNLYTRDEIGFGPRDKDTGLEIGVELGPVLVTGSITNGAGAERLLDDNARVAWTGRVEWIQRIGAFRLLLGGSIYANETGARTVRLGVVTDSRTDTLRAGGHWGLSFGRFTALGEVAYVEVQPSEDSLDAANDSLRSFTELDVQIVRGIELVAGHEFRDADISLRSGVAHRITGGLDFFPVPQVHLTALYRHTLGSGRNESLNDGFKEILGLVHLYY